jgi:hypothetical protein
MAPAPRNPDWHCFMKPLPEIPKGEKKEWPWTEVGGGYIYDRKPSN